ncbi:MAG: asparagine synthase-related protein [Blastocatellales bacterium]
MSGFVVLMNLDGKPIQRELIQGMTRSMVFRGPDDQRYQCLESVGLGHAMLRTTFESSGEQQPLSVDGLVWIVADARVDARLELIAKLSGDGSEDLPHKPDAELILRAYLKWGEECLDHLIGDFSFAIWDSRTNLLFCARDHFGIKPLYYALTPQSLIVSNTIDCVTRHPQVSRKVNELAIGDYLLWGSNEFPDTTFYSDVNKIPPAHKLIYRQPGVKLERYWSLPIQEELHYRRQSDYIEHFIELLNLAVADRLRTDKVAIFLSGGIDSPTIATSACENLISNQPLYKFEAFTAVYDYLIPDQERYYSGLVSEKLGIPINYLACDEFRLFEGWDSPELRTPEPSYEPLSIISLTQYRQVSADYRVALTGHGGDVILRPSFSHILNLIRELRAGQAIRQYVDHLIKNRRLPRIGLRTWIRKSFGKINQMEYYPKRINKEFEDRIDLRSRWKELTSEPPSAHPFRPEAYRILNSVFWANQFESCDPGNSNFTIEHRYPLFDIRLVSFTMQLPSIPWCVDKKLMRESMKNRLPEQVLRRNKAPLAGDPTGEKRRRGLIARVSQSQSIDHLKEYLDCNSTSLYQSLDAESGDYWYRTLPVCLNFWLQNVHST